jgi:hypothetical protein
VPITVHLGFLILSLSTCVWIVAGTHPGLALESPNQKTPRFHGSNRSPAVVSERAHQLFSEMFVRT